MNPSNIYTCAFSPCFFIRPENQSWDHWCMPYCVRIMLLLAVISLLKDKTKHNTKTNTCNAQGLKSYEVALKNQTDQLGLPSAQSLSCFGI